MNDNEAEQWCRQNNWTQPRQLELGIWVAFPPGGFIETPLPLQTQKSKARPIQYILDLALVAIVTVAMLAISIIMSPCFIEPIISRRRNKCSDKLTNG